MDAIADHASEGMLAVGDDRQVLAANRRACELLDRESLVGLDVREVFPPSIESVLGDRQGSGVPAGVAGEADLSSEAGTEVRYEEYVPTLERWLAIRAVAEGERTLVYLEDITDWKRREQELEGQRDQLATLSRINGLVGDLMGALVGAADRADVETTVCNRLTGTELFPLAFVAERDPTGAGIRVTTTVGEREGILEHVRAAAERGAGPEWAALEDGEPQIVDDLPASDWVPEPIRRSAFAAGLQSVVAVPLTYGETVHGVLAVYSTRPEAFTDRARDGFVALGAVVGFAITAARQRNLILSDTFVELTFRVEGSGSVLATVSADLDCTLTVEGVVPVTDDRLFCYVTVSGASADAVARAVAEGERELTGGEAATRAIYDHDDEGLVEVRLTGESPLVLLSGAGAAVSEATLDEGSGRIVVAVAPDDDVRALASRIADAVPGSELVAKRQRERAVETVQEFRNVLHDRLTDRQRTALRTAYYGDYFESPRGSTAEELADVLDITSPTFHHHLRAAERKLFDALFSEPRRYDPE
jgi:predicted DNA binding protein